MLKRVSMLVLALAAASAEDPKPDVLSVGPGSQPVLSVAPSGAAWMAWGTSKGEVRVASLKPGEKDFSDPIVVARDPGLPLGMHRGPRIAATAAGLAVTWVGVKGSDLVCRRSTDGGKTWEGPARVNAVPGTCGEALHALAADAKGTLVACWLSKQGGGKQGQDLLFSVSKDLGKTFSKPAPVYVSPSGSVCPCCHPSLSSGDEKVWAMWRNDLDGSRDLYCAELDAKKGRFGNAVKQGEGTWKLAACPMDGGGVSPGKAGPVSVWRRGREVFAVLGGATKEVLLGEGQDPAVAGDLAVWVSRDAIHAKRLDAQGKVFRLADPPAGVRQGSPSVAALPDGSFLAAWEENGEVRALRIP